MSLTDVTTTPIRPVGRRRTRVAWTMTPSRSSVSTSARPTPSRPTAQMSWTRVPRRPSQRAALAAEPPWRSITRPDTSVPRTIVCDGVRTASSIRSPRTTTDGRFDRPPPIGPRRSRRAIPVAPASRPRGVEGDAEGRSAIAPSITAEGGGPLVGWPHPGARTPSRRPRLGQPTIGSPSHDRRRRDARPPRHRHDPDPVDRRRPEGELGPPGRTDGRGADGLHAVDALPAPRPARSEVARSRSVRPERRPRQHAALLAPPPDRLRPPARRSSSSSASGAAGPRATRSTG